MAGEVKTNNSTLPKPIAKRPAPHMRRSTEAILGQAKKLIKMVAHRHVDAGDMATANKLIEITKSL